MILWPDGFSHYGVDRTKMDSYGYVGTSWTPSTTRPRIGTHSLAYVAGGGGSSASINGSCIFRRSFPTPQTAVKIGYAIWIPNYPSSELGFQGAVAVILASFLTATGLGQVNITLGVDGSIAAYAYWAWDQGLFFGHGAELGRSNPAVVHFGAWNHFEILTTIGTPGTIEVRIDGVTQLSLVGVDTDPYGTGTVTQWVFSGGTLNGMGTMYVADLIASDTIAPNDDFLGDQVVFTQFPDNDTTVEDWIPSTGTMLYPIVDNPVPDDAGPYVEAQNAGDVMGLTFPDLDPEIVTVAAVAMFHRTEKTGPGASTIQTSVDVNGNVLTGNNRPMVTVYQGYIDVFDLDPDGLIPWPPADVNALTFFSTRTA